MTMLMLGFAMKQKKPTALATWHSLYHPGDLTSKETKREQVSAIQPQQTLLQALSGSKQSD